MARVAKALNDTAAFLRLGWRRANELIDKYGPSAQLERFLGRVFTKPAPSERPTLSAYALTGALVGSAAVGVAALLGLIPAHGIAMIMAGATAFTLLNDHWSELHAQLPTAMLILGVVAPATLFTVNSKELWRVTQLPPEAGKVISWLWKVALDAIPGLSRFFTAMKPVKPLARLRGLWMRLQFRRRPANPAV